MGRVAQRDLRALLECLRESYALRDLDAFAAHIVWAIPKIVSSDITTYNEVNPRRRRDNMVWDPRDAMGPELVGIFEQHMLEHPLIAHYRQTRDDRAFKISDFLTRSQLHRLGLYNEFFRRLDVEDQMAVGLAAPPPLVIGIALNRSRRDFTERDRLLLNLLGPHLIQAYRNAEAVTQRERELALVRQGVEQLDGGVILLAPEGHVRLMTVRAREWVADYFGGPLGRADRLREPLHRWVRDQEAHLARTDDVPPPRTPLVVEREGKRLVVRLLSDFGQHLLLLEEQRMALEPAALEPLGLTRREAEVLAWVAEGKSNAEIGMILGTRPRTVAKHLERIYPKLGVESRTAAAGVALRSTAEA